MKNVYEELSVKYAKYLLIPLFNVEISRFIPFWKEVETGLLLRKVRTAVNYQTVYEYRLKGHYFDYPVLPFPTTIYWRLSLVTAVDRVPGDGSCPPPADAATAAAVARTTASP